MRQQLASTIQQDQKEEQKKAAKKQQVGREGGREGRMIAGEQKEQEKATKRW